MKEDEVPRCPGCGEDVLIEWDAVLRRCSSIRRRYRCARSNSSVMRASRSSCWSDDSSGGRNGSGFRRAMMASAIITCAYLARNQGKLLVGEISVPFRERHNSLIESIGGASRRRTYSRHVLTRLIQWSLTTEYRPLAGWLYSSRCKCNPVRFQEP